MAKPHWFHGESQQHGCQHSACNEKALWQWQRKATEQEIQAEASLQGPYGDVIRNSQGPHVVAVFACEQHTPKLESGAHHLDNMAMHHASDCPAPDEGCGCG